MRYIIFIIILGCSVRLYSFEKTNYVFDQSSIDVVIPCHEKDAAVLNRAIESIKKNVFGVRRIMVISSTKLTDQAEWIDEKIFPFNKEDIALQIFKSTLKARWQIDRPKSRMGWIYQQFLKLFAPLYIPNISSNVLIVDADVVFLKPIVFMQPNGAGLYDVGEEYNVPYFDHMVRILPGLRRLSTHSGIVHHMLFQKPVLEDLFDLIQKHHGLEPWVAIARAIPVDSENNMAFSAMSEYEMYFNFVFARTSQVKVRPLKRADAGIFDALPVNEYEARGYDYVAIHSWNS